MAQEREAASLRVAIVDDHPALREGLASVIANGGCTVVGTASDAAAGRALVHAARPDVALVDISLDGESGLELARTLSAESPRARVILYTGLTDLATLTAALDSPVEGVLLKAGDPAELLEALRVVGGGGTYVDRRLHSLLLSERRADRVGALSYREREVLTLLALGETSRGIAEQLFLSPETVKTHVRNAMVKLGARTRAQAITLAIKADEIEPREISGGC